jgi:hypothetical protein
LRRVPFTFHWSGGMTRSHELADGIERPPYLYAALAGTLVFALYALTLAPTTAFWDTSEYIATAHILGIPHPPGNPLFVLLARAWELLLAPTGLSVAVRVNLFSALMGAGSAALWFLVAHRILRFGGGGERAARVGAAAAALIAATAFTTWNQSVVNEKVYTVSLFTIALASWLALRWRDTGFDARPMLLVVYLLFLAVGNHLMTMLAAPALLSYVLRVRPRALASGRLLGVAAAVAALGLSVQLFLPIRAGLDPRINEGDPRCASLSGAVVSAISFGKAGCPALSANLNREQYGKPSVLVSPIDRVSPRDAGLLAAQAANYLQYFDWQWARSVAGERTVFGMPRPLVSLLFLALGIFGAGTHRRWDRASWTYLAVLFAMLSAGLVFYMNFRLGYSLAGDTRVTEVRERDYFFFVGFSVWGVWAGVGLAELWRRLAERIAVRRPGVPALAFASPVLLVALLPLALNWSWASRAGDYAARDWAYNVLQSVEPYGVLFTNGDNDTFPLWYLQEVEGVRRDVTVMVTTYLNAPWYAPQVRDLTRPCPPGVSAADDPTRILCQAAYAGDGPAIYTPDGRPPLPEDTILPLSDAEIAAVTGPPYGWVAPEPLLLRAGRIEATIPAGTVVTPADTFVTAIVQAVIGKRPVHFMAGGSAATLGLEPFLVRQGLTMKLHDGPVEPGGGIAPVPPSDLSALTGAWVHLPATDTLLREVFIHRSGIPDDWPVWTDAPSGNIPAQYAWAHLAAAQAHADRGAPASALSHRGRARAWLRLSGLAE